MSVTLPAPAWLVTLAEGYGPEDTALALDDFAQYGLHLDDDPPEQSGPLASVRRGLSELAGGRPEPGLLLLADLRRLHRKAAGVSLDWELLAQGAQAVKDTDLVSLAQSCHPQTLRQLTWTNAMLKTLSPQVLAS